MSDFRWQLPELQWNAPYRCEQLEFNDTLYTQNIEGVGGDVFAFRVIGEQVHSVFVTRSELVTGVIRKRAFLICDIHIPTRGVVYRQPFYRSSGTATPTLSPKGTWWPFDCLWTDSHVANLQEQGQFLDIRPGWLGKYNWSTQHNDWVPHNKRHDRLSIVAQRITEWLTATIKED